VHTRYYLCTRYTKWRSGARSVLRHSVEVEGWDNLPDGPASCCRSINRRGRRSGCLVHAARPHVRLQARTELAAVFGGAGLGPDDQHRSPQGPEPSSRSSSRARSARARLVDRDLPRHAHQARSTRRYKTGGRVSRCARAPLPFRSQSTRRAVAAQRLIAACTITVSIGRRSTRAARVLTKWRSRSRAGSKPRCAGWHPSLQRSYMRGQVAAARAQGETPA